MNCQEVERILIEGGELRQDVREHLSSCRSCRQFARLMESATAPRPSVELDKAVLAQVKAEMRMRGRRRPAWLHIAYAAAASVLLALSLWVGRLAFWNGDGEADVSGESLLAVAEADEQAMPVDPLVSMWMDTDDGIGDVEFTIKYSDLVADMEEQDLETETADGRNLSSEEFSNLADGMFSLELMMYQTLVN